ncbi:MAG: hypothetical protein HDR22_11960 [Lachnospiraceae bacterium]|nr:hypothetical protein [Lachnospiraceae bacterium]
MKTMKKKVFTTVLACFMACLMFSMPVLASSNYFTKSTAKLNAMDGNVSAIKSFTSGSVSGTNPKITQVKVYLNVASGTDPFTFYLKSPEGTVAELYPSTKSGTYYITDFNGENPSGTWYVQIENQGITYDPNKLYPASTVTPSVTVTYSY